MTLRWTIALAALLTGPALRAGSAAPAYHGFSLGMFRNDAVATLRQKGFSEFFDVDAGTRNGEPIPKLQLEEVIEKTTEKALSEPATKQFPCLLNHALDDKSGRYLTCSFKTSPLEPMSQLSLYFKAERLARLVLVFHNAKAQTTITEIRNRFGLPTSEGNATEFLELNPANSLENVGCRDGGCRILGWRKKSSGRAFTTWAIYRAQNPNEGQAVSLRIGWDEKADGRATPRTARNVRSRR